MSQVSIRRTLGFVVWFLRHDAGKALSYTVIPALTGGIVLYVSLFLYLLELERYLVLPSDRVASLVLGLATAGLLLTLFMHSVVATAITTLVLDRPCSGWKYFCVSRPVWRLYAAYLRFLLVCAAFIAVCWAGDIFFYRVVGVHEWLDPVFNVTVTAGLLFLGLRLGFLIAPVAIATDQGPVVRESWHLSYPSFGALAVIMGVSLLLVFCVETAGELVIRFTGNSILIQAGATAADTVAAYRAFLPKILCAIGIAYMVGINFGMSAAANAYRQQQTSAPDGLLS